MQPESASTIGVIDFGISFSMIPSLYILETKLNKKINIIHCKKKSELILLFPSGIFDTNLYLEILETIKTYYFNISIQKYESHVNIFHSRELI